MWLRATQSAGSLFQRPSSNPVSSNHLSALVLIIYIQAISELETEKKEKHLTFIGANRLRLAQLTGTENLGPEPTNPLMCEFWWPKRQQPILTTSILSTMYASGWYTAYREPIHIGSVMVIGRLKIDTCTSNEYFRKRIGTEQLFNQRCAPSEVLVASLEAVLLMCSLLSGAFVIKRCRNFAQFYLKPNCKKLVKYIRG
ncbi:hypothetical protein T265_09250 [Opisthorchis viverrini]|uniref:Uncharacterized protein n=1 Tax=Opisthorchis viverrini TaxID=6198 RepID=A0A074ZHI5_OPIVI|nr:hypothetical protein T265_09250 [Opisthorchis viverrini]KER22695.1 hypothetical protein T265_09250 [Opisthorchis viverrini]